MDKIMKTTYDCGHTIEYTKSDILSHRLMVGDSTKIEELDKLTKQK